MISSRALIQSTMISTSIKSGVRASRQNWPCQLLFWRDVHSYPLSENLTFITNHKLNPPKNLQILNADEENRPLILLFTWLRATEKNSRRYSKIFTDRGYDVLRVDSTLKELWRPVLGMKPVARQIAEILRKNENFKEIVIHGMSVGAYGFTEVMHQMEENYPLYESTLKRIVGQIYDSPVDILGAPIGTSQSITEIKFLQKIIQALFHRVMDYKYEDITRHYYRSHKTYHSNRANLPGLFINSEVDPVSDIENNIVIMNKWLARGIPTRMVRFKDSPHVFHFHHHKEEYLQAVFQFLNDFVTIPPLPVPSIKQDKVPKDVISLHIA